VVSSLRAPCRPIPNSPRATRQILWERSHISKGIGSRSLKCALEQVGYESMILTLENIREVFLSAFPEVVEWAKSNLGNDCDLDEDFSEIYPFFEDVVQRMLYKFLEARTKGSMLTRLFRFFETMAGSHDQDVVDLLGIAILEMLVYKKESLRLAWSYLGPKSRVLVISEARYQGRLDNLPSS
jgi:hypothetical protein